MRRGANMGVLRVDHPDILEFATAKLDSRRLTNFNLSVAVTDAFMEAAAVGGSIELVNPRTGLAERTIDARRLLRTIATAAWRSGDPGVLFLDRIAAGNPIPEEGAIEATNPCGEQPLLPFESCVLGSVNLARFAAGGAIDWPRLGGRCATVSTSSTTSSTPTAIRCRRSPPSRARIARSASA